MWRDCWWLECQRWTNPLSIAIPGEAVEAGTLSKWNTGLTLPAWQQREERWSPYATGVLQEDDKTQREVNRACNSGKCRTCLPFLPRHLVSIPLTSLLNRSYRLECPEVLGKRKQKKLGGGSPTSRDSDLPCQHLVSLTSSLYFKLSPLTKIGPG